MTPDDFLEYEVVLMLAKYGEKKVLSAIAKKLGLSYEEIENKLRKIDEIRPKKPRSKPSESGPTIEALLAQYPNKRKYLEILFTRFQNKTFLPEFRQIKQFFERRTADIGQVKSRTKAMSKLFKLLGSLEESELATLCQDSEKGEQSSLGIISDEIMKRRK